MYTHITTHHNDTKVYSYSRTSCKYYTRKLYIYYTARSCRAEEQTECILQPIALGVSFNLNLQSHWSLFTYV